MPAFSILLRDKTLFGESAYKIIIYAVIAWTIHSKHNTFLLKSPPRPLCCAVLKIRPDMSLPARIQKESRRNTPALFLVSYYALWLSAAFYLSAADYRPGQSCACR